MLEQDAIDLAYLMADYSDEMPEIRRIKVTGSFPHAVELYVGDGLWRVLQNETDWIAFLEEVRRENEAFRKRSEWPLYGCE